ncbi:hypothetical protein BDN67DRAFT_977521 [Paxillus ammoniavirescens]|nr:hypothetical protein BDN67DRAFT_977521 [Paxillus ammoniavirescens]
MWCTRWFLPLLLLPLPTAPPYFLVLFLFTLVLLAALLLSSCYWQSFPLDARLSAPWADNVTTFYDALNATIRPELNLLDFTPPIMRVADRCWCDFASGVFEPYDVQKWERDSVERAVVEIESEWKKRSEAEGDAGLNATTLQLVEEPKTTNPIGGQQYDTSQQAPSATRGALSIFRSIFGRPLTRAETSPTSSSSIIPSTPPEIPATPSTVEPPLPVETSLSPGQVDMRPFGVDLILDYRWSRKA